MNNLGAGKSVAQTFFISLYRWLCGDAVRRTRLGRWAFERAYLAYKIVLEAGPIEGLARYVRRGTWVIDVGANIGIFTLRFARNMGAERVIAIEPELQNFDALQRRIAAAGLKDLIITRRAVAAEKTGVLHLAVNPDHPGDHKLASHGVPVAALTLDGLLSEYGEPVVSLIKIDVQGAEMRVLQGAESVIGRDKPALFVEIDGAALQQQGASIAHLIEWLGQRGYRPYRLRRLGAPVPVTAQQLLESSTYTDTLFLSQP